MYPHEVRFMNLKNYASLRASIKCNLSCFFFRKAKWRQLWSIFNEGDLAFFSLFDRTVKTHTFSCFSCFRIFDIVIDIHRTSGYDEHRNPNLTSKTARILSFKFGKQQSNCLSCKSLANKHIHNYIPNDLWFNLIKFLLASMNHLYDWMMNEFFSKDLLNEKPLHGIKENQQK